MSSVNERSLLLIGHPGHELRVYGWLAAVKPLVCILTDGAGSDGEPRTEQTLAILRELGAPLGPVCGQFSDREIYRYMLNGDIGVFATLRDRIADILIDAGIDTVVSDGVEGYNPTHDLCHALASAAIARARRIDGRVIRHLCIPLMGDPHDFGDGMSPVAQHLHLDHDLYRRKMQTIHAYASAGGETLQREVAETMARFGSDAFAHETLFDAATPSWPEWTQRFVREKPHYETYGEAQVAAGKYRFVISFAQHVQPLIDHLLAGGHIQAPSHNPDRPCGS